MKFKTNFAIISVLVTFLMLGMAPGSSRQAAAAGDHPMDQALLLMFSSHMRMAGDVELAQLSSAHLAAPPSQTQADIDNEINAVIDLYVTMIANLQASGNYSRAVEDQLVSQMNEKVDALQAKAQALEAKRSNSNRGGFIRSVGRAFNRVVKAVGRGTGWVVGKAMDGAGEVGTFAVEEVTPQVLREYALGGAPLNAKLFRHVARELLKKRVRTAAENYVLRLAERINKRQAAQGEALPTLDPVAQATQDAWDADFMEAFEEGDEGGQTDSGGGTSGPNFTTYTFTDRDVPNFGSSSFGTSMFTWHRWTGHVPDAYLPIYNYCFYVSNIPIETGTVRVTFDQETMTASGSIEGDFHITQTSLAEMGTDEIDVRGSYRIEFSNLPGTSTDNGYTFKGTGNADLQIGGSIICRGRDTDTDQDFFKPIPDESSAQMQIPLSVTLWNPGTMVGGSQPATVSISGDAGPVNDLSISVLLVLE
ncbi:MAG: hypothetical protein JW757_10030 [Anaerolineales bacterium]|nr:hypothetical protein [Anaerolineales bacterium]